MTYKLFQSYATFKLCTQARGILKGFALKALNHQVNRQVSNQVNHQVSYHVSRQIKGKKHQAISVKSVQVKATRQKSLDSSH